MKKEKIIICQPTGVGSRAKKSQVYFNVLLLLTILVNLKHLFNFFDSENS